MSRKSSLCVCLVVLVLLQNCSEGSHLQEREGPSEGLPNFVIIFTDDQGYADVGVFGAIDIKTPNLDRMAGRGVKFTSFYVAAPACTPSRAALMTGCYPKRVGLASGVLWPRQTKGLSPEEITVAELLKEKGYATACIGKWHLGRPVELLPTRQGFDTYFGVPYSNDMTPDHILSILGLDFPPLPLMRDERVIEEGVAQETLTKRYVGEALRFISENRDRPFFLYLAHNMPHYPAHASEEFEDRRIDENHRGIYASAVEEIDWGVGRILDSLENFNLDRNTLVIFTSDNGPWLLAKTLFREVTGSALPLRGWKGETFEGGMRVPTIMQWPGRLPEGTECRQLATTMDMLPTFARYAGVELPPEPEHRIDGRDISGMMEAPWSASPHEYLYYYDSDSGLLEAVRDAEGWKLHVRRGRRIVAELYYLPDDIGESVDLYSLNPDVVKRLREVADAFDAELTENVRPVGRAGG
jgi:arylsulfatase A